MSNSSFASRMIVAGVLALAAAGLARAQVATAAFDFAAQMGTENAVLTNQLTLNSSHTQSGVAAGGATTLSNGSVLNQNQSYTDDAYAFRTYGQLTLASNDQSLNRSAAIVQNASVNSGLQAFTNGNTRVLTFEGSVNSADKLTLNGNSGMPAPVNFLAAADNYFTKRATALAADASIFASASSLAPSYSNGTLIFSAGAGTYTVFNLDLSTAGLLGGLNQIQFNLPTNSTAIVNVTGLSPGSTWSPMANFLGNPSGQASRILWNFENGINLTTNREFYGSILGLNSTITASGQNLDGQIFAQNLSISSGELHYLPFAPIPEISDAAMLIGTVGIIGALMRRRGLARAAGS